METPTTQTSTDRNVENPNRRKTETQTDRNVGRHMIISGSVCCKRLLPNRNLQICEFCQAVGTCIRIFPCHCTQYEY